MKKNKPNKIKIITNGNFPYGRASANYLRNLSFLLSEDNEVEVLLPTGYNYGKIKNENTKKVNWIKNIKYRHLSFINRPSSIIGKILDAIKGRVSIFFYLFFVGLKSDVNVIVKYNTSLFFDLFLLIFCRIFKVKFITILPEFYVKPNNFGLKRIKWQFFYWGIKHLSKYKDGIIVLSHYLHKFVRQRNFNNPILLLPNIIQPKYFDVKSFPFKKDKITIGYTGTPTKKDGIDDLLKSFAIVYKNNNNTHLLVIGDTAQKSSLPILKKKAEHLKIAENVTFTGLVNFKDIPRLLNSCDILVLSRPKSIQSEAGFPTKLGEYMACKKPIVLTAVGDMKNYFENTDIVQLVEPGNIDSISAGITDFINNPEKRKFIGINGYNWMLENLSIENTSKKIKRYLNTICDI